MQVSKLPSAATRHAAALAPRLSEMDRQECEVYGISDIHQTLTEGVVFSHQSVVFEHEGRVLAVGGVMSTAGGTIGVPWMLSADPSEYSLSAAKGLVKLCRDCLTEWHGIFPQLRGMVWSKADRHIKLLRKLGFNLGPTQTTDVNGRATPPTIFFEHPKPV